MNKTICHLERTDRSKNYPVFLLFTFAFLLLHSCKETDDYYKVLKDQPEMLNNYQSVYAVDDTLQITGRFRRNGLVVKIGDATADIVGFQSRLNTSPNALGYNDSIQDIKVLIDASMGIATNRAVHVTSAGITIQGKEIEIVEDARSGILSGELTVEKLVDYPTGSTPVYCRSGNGNLYFRNSSTQQITLVRPDGSTETVFEADDLKAADGTPYRITRVDGTGIDPAERYLYLCVFTQFTGSEPESFYRLFRWDIVERTLEVLNETPYHRLLTRRTLESIHPYEGGIAGVKLFSVPNTNIFPDSEGNVYFVMGRSGVNKLDANGNYTYVFKSTWDTDGLSDVYNPQTGAAYPANYINQLRPGVTISFFDVLTLAPESDQLFTINYSVVNNAYSFDHYNLRSRTFINDFANARPGGTRHISGSFPVLSGWVSSNVLHNLWGALPVDGEGLLILYNNTSNPRYPTQWGILDFVAKRGKRYAPGTFDYKEYQINANDALLNYDTEGMLYMTANSRTVILKTVFK